MNWSAPILSLCIAAASISAAAADEPVPPVPTAPTSPTAPPAGAEVRAACTADVQKLCAGVQPGGGRIIACLKQHKDEVSAGCKEAIGKAAKRPT
jgi:hypothetical protein